MQGLSLLLASLELNQGQQGSVCYYRFLSLAFGLVSFVIHK